MNGSFLIHKTLLGRPSCIPKICLQYVMCYILFHLALYISLDGKHFRIRKNSKIIRIRFNQHDDTLVHFFEDSKDLQPNYKHQRYYSPFLKNTFLRLLGLDVL